jgi:undecaprenyl diphosphate synthase
MINFSTEITESERELIANLSEDSIPRHIAIIMDGNGRWAKKRARNRIFGHHQGRETVRKIVEAVREIGIHCLTLYTFSTENWSRSKVEVAGLMSLLKTVLTEELASLHSNGVKIIHLGEKLPLPEGVRKAIEEAEARTFHNTGMTLALAINYGGRRELVLAASRGAKACADGEIEPADLLDETVFERYLQTDVISEPDLMIRTAGEQRISNFLLWKLAYSELYFTDVLWPEFTREDLLKALVSYQKRERRFGGVL